MPILTQRLNDPSSPRAANPSPSSTPRRREASTDSPDEAPRIDDETPREDLPLGLLEDDDRDDPPVPVEDDESDRE